MFVRRDELEAIGGWSVTALTEDLELSTRLEAYGRHVTLAPETAVEEEAVESWAALWRQRLRWAEEPSSPPRARTAHRPRHAIVGPEGGLPRLRRRVPCPAPFATTILASLLTVALPRPADWSVPVTLFLAYGLGIFILALGGLWATGARGIGLLGRAFRGAVFLSHWLVVVPFALARIAFGPEPKGFVKTPRFAKADR